MGVSAEVGIYYGACVASVRGESNTDNNCSPAVKITVSGQVATEEEEDETLGGGGEASPPDRDRAALIAFYNSMDGPNWANNTNWLSDKPIGAWYGITTDNSGRVIGIDMWYNGLKGQLPLQFDDLTALERLSLVGSGISDLSVLSNLPRLTYLELRQNSISDVSPLLSLRSRLKTPCRAVFRVVKRSRRRAFFIGRDALDPSGLESKQRSKP